MLIAKDIQKLLGQLNFQENTHITVNDSDILIHFEQDKFNLSLSTVVYNGGNYIPSSVRRSLSRKFPFSHYSISTFLTIDEPSFQIVLNYVNKTVGSLSYIHFKDLLEEFGSIAEQWRAHLDENDKNDLVYVRAK